MKKRTFLLAFVLVLVLAAVGGVNAWALSAPEDRTQPVATVTVDEGEAFLRHGGGSWEPVAADARVAAGDQVKTNAKSQATINFFDGATARLDERSEVVVQELAVDAENHALTRVGLGVTAGRVWSRVAKLLDQDASFTVQSSTVVATVRGTAFVTDVSAAEGDFVQVVDGLVGVAKAPASGDPLAEPSWQDMRAGEEAWMPKKAGRAAGAMERRAMAERFRSSAWYRKNQMADEQYIEHVKGQRERRLSALGGVMPGDVRYPLRRFGERLRLALTTDPDARQELRLAYQGRRFAEAVLLARTGKADRAQQAVAGYVEALRAMHREVQNGGLPPEAARRRVRRMVGRVMEHRMLIAAVNGAGVPVPEALQERMMGDRSEIDALMETMAAAFPDAMGWSEMPRRLAPLAPAVTVEEAPATSTPETVNQNLNVNTNVNTNQPAPTNTNQPTAAVPASLAVIGTRTIMNTPDSQQFRAILTLSDGSTRDVTAEAAWTLVGDPVGTLTRGDLVTSAAGNATVQASHSGFSGSYAVRVLPPQQATLTQVSVAPATATVKGGMRQTFTATAHYSDGSTRDVTASASWSLSGDPVGSLSANTFTAFQVTTSGIATVTARYTDGSTLAGTAAVSVVP